MAFPTTFAGWITYLRDWCGADEYSDGQIGSFLDLAQLRLNREMESYGMEAVVSIPLAAPTPVDLTATVPDFRKVRLVVIQGFPPLDVASLVEIQQLIQEAAASGAASTTPEKYCIDAGKLFIYPVQSTGTIDFYYYKDVPFISSTGPVNSNVFTLEYPDALLYASLLAAAPYMKENEDVDIWSNAYLAALSTANDESNRIKKGSTPLVRKVNTYG